MLSENIPNARAVIIKNAGHFPHMEKPETVNGVLWELSVGVASEHGCASLAPAHAAARRVSADQQVNLSGHAGTSAIRVKTLSGWIDESTSLG